MQVHDGVFRIHAFGSTASGRGHSRVIQVRVGRIQPNECPLRRLFHGLATPVALLSHLRHRRRSRPANHHMIDIDRAPVGIQHIAG